MKQAEWPIRVTLAVILVLCGITFKQWVAVGCVGAFLLLTVLPMRVTIDRVGELIVGLVCLGATYVLTVVIGPPPKHPLSEAFALIQAFVCIWCLLYSSARLFFSNPWGGQQGTLLFSLLGIFACGGNQIGLTYHTFVALFALLALWALARADDSRPSFQRSTPRRKLLLGGALASSAIIAMCFFVLLPFVYHKVTRQIRLALMNRTQTGFDLYFRLGSLTKMLQSRRIVLRVKGPGKNYLHLRGMIYNRYYNKHWRTPRKTRAKMVRLPKKAKGNKQRRWTVRYVSGESSRYFLPLHHAALSSPLGQVRIDGHGIVKPLPEQTPDSISFSMNRTLSKKLLKPHPDDLQVPHKLRFALISLASQWTKGLTTPLQKLRRIRHKLHHDYKYSLSFKRPKKREPILDFLLYNKQGHCEYFASAMALLARSIGIPTRVIGGYLTSEYNALGQYMIVRDQNAHSWVEAWTAGNGWQTFDPTPPEGVSSHMPKRSGTFASVLDLVRVWFDDFRTWITNLTVTQLSLTIGFFILLWIGIRLRRHFKGKAGVLGAPDFAYRDPLPSFEAMLATLHNIVSKKQSESLESYARRLLQKEQHEAAQQAVPLILAYASFRYGNVGNGEELSQQMNAWLSQFQEENSSD